jgi:hypothetical protein
MTTERIAWILILLILLAFCLGAYSRGYVAGAKSAILWGVRLSHNFVNITFNNEEVAQGIFQYRNNIGGCYNAIPNF